MSKLVYVGAGELTGSFGGNKPWLKPIEDLRNAGFEVWFENDTSEDEEMFAKCWAMIPSRKPVGEEVLQKSSNLKLITKTGVGLDRIDIPACTAHGVCVVNTPKANLIAVAEHTIALMLAAAKNLYPLSLYIRNDYPDLTCTKRYRSVELYGKTLAVIGVGRIGSRVAKMLNAFDMKIIGVDPFIDHSQRPDYIEWATLDEALPRADFVTLHVTAEEKNRGLIGAKQLAQMKKSAVMVNTSRGYIIDEKSLYEALASNSIGSAGIDVFEVEPLKPCNPLMHLENFVATPHFAASTPESAIRAMEECALLIREYAEGKRPEGAANDVSVG